MVSANTWKGLQLRLAKRDCAEERYGSLFKKSILHDCEVLIFECEVNMREFAV